MTRPIAIVRGKAAQSPVVVGLGGNLGKPIQAFRAAIGSLSRLAPVHAVSQLYRSAPMGPPQPDFLNAAVLVDFGASLHELLLVLQTLEAEAGRERAIRWGPRTLDLDILWAGPRTESSSTLSVPHPGLMERAFALLPLLDVYPDARDPVSGTSYSGLVLAQEQSSCKSVEGANWWAEVTAQ